MLLLHLDILRHERSLYYFGHFNGIVSILDCGASRGLFRKNIQHPYRHADIDEEADHVVGDLDEGAGGEGGVYFEAFEGEGDEGAEDGGEDHHAE